MPSLKCDLEELYDRFNRQMFSCALAVTRSHDLAEDALQEAFCHLLQLDHAPRELKAYAFRSVRNAALDLARRRRYTEPLEEEHFF